MLKKIVWSDYPCEVPAGAINNGGYVVRRGFNGPSQHPHINACVSAHGPRPKGHTVDHLCRNKACCNPRHLEWVTQSENQKRAAKGRAARTEISDAVVLYAVAEVQAGRTCTEVSKEIGIHRNVVKDWANGRSRSKLTGLVHRKKREHVVHI